MIRNENAAKDDAPPFLDISLGPGSDDYWVEELTFNPFITRKPLRRGSDVEVWMEIVLRCNVESGVSRVPKVILEFRGDLANLVNPNCHLNYIASDPGNFLLDINFLMHADIWYSFVRLKGSDREFMVKGYNQPTRLLYSCPGCQSSGGLHVNREQWIGSDTEVSSVYAFQEDMLHLIKKIKLFNQKAVHPARSYENFFEKRNVRNPLDRKMDWEVLVPRDKSVFAPVYFQAVPDLRGRFAVRRLPWKHGLEIGEQLYGISYGGSFTLSSEGEKHTLTPLLFSGTSPEYVDAILGPGEAIRFWVRWKSDAALNIDHGRDQFNFRYVVSPRSNIEQFNTFFRVPEGFDFVPGGVTDLRHYSVPPRLFFIWGDHNTDACFSFSTRFETGGIDEVGVSASFYDKTVERKRLSDIFVIGFLGNIVAGLCLSLFFGQKGKDGFGQYDWVGPFLGLGILSVSGIFVYQGGHLRWLYLLGALSLAGLVPFAMKSLGLWSAFIFLLLSVVMLAYSLKPGSVISALSRAAVIVQVFRNWRKRLQLIRSLGKGGEVK